MNSVLIKKHKRTRILVSPKFRLKSSKLVSKLPASLYTAAPRSSGRPVPLQMKALAVTTGTGSINGTVLGAGSPNSPIPGQVTVALEQDSGGVGVTVAYTYADQQTGTYTLSNIPAGRYTIRFIPQSYDGIHDWAFQYWGNKPTESFANYFDFTDGQNLSGMDMVLPLGAQLSGSFTLQGAPKVDIRDVLRVYLNPRENCNCGGDVNNDSGYTNLSANGDGAYPFTIVGLPANGYTVGIGTDTHYGVPDSSIFLPGNVADAVDLQGPFFEVPVSGQVDVGFAGTLVWGYALQERVSSFNPSQNICNCERADPVSSQSGELHERVGDLSIPGVGPEVQLTRDYSSSLASRAGVFGAGWVSPMDTHLASTDGQTMHADISALSIDWVQENGSVVRFYRDANTGTYGADGHSRATLSWDTTSQQWTAIRKNALTFKFDAAGNITSETDRNGNAVSFTRDASTLVTGISGSGGRGITLTYTGGLITKAQDNAGRSVSYSYDGANNLASVTAADGSVTKYGYSAEHYLTTATNGLGGTTSNVFNGSGQVTQQTDPSGRITTFRYSYSNALPTVTTTYPDGTAVTDAYARGALADTAFTNGGESSFTYDGFLNVSSSTDSSGNVTRYTSDADGNRLTSTDPLGNTTTYTYDSLDNVTSVTDPLSRKTTYSYDSRGNKTGETSPSGRSQSWIRNPDGTAASWTDGNGHTTIYTYDAGGRLATTTDAANRTVKLAYDSAGNVSSRTDPGGNATTFTTDGAGRVLTTKDPLGNTTTNTYDADGNLVSAKDAAGNTKLISYSTADERTSTTTPSGAKTTYTYTGYPGHIAASTDPGGNTTTYTWGYGGDLAAITDAAGRRTSFAHDGNHNLVSTYLPSGASDLTSFDANNNVVSYRDNTGKTTTTTYDAAGERTKVTDPLNRATAYTYTADEQIASVTLPSGRTTTSLYDKVGNTTSYTDPDGKVTTYAFDAANLPTSRVAPGALTTRFGYDSAGRLATTTNPDATTTTRSYDAANELLRQHFSQAGATDTTYTYDPDGRRATMVDSTGTTNSVYNADGRLTSEKNGAGTTLGYSYDAVGNLTTITYPSARTVTYGYDKTGLMTSVKDWGARTTAFTYTSDSQILKETLPNGLTQTSTYDANDRPTTMTTASSTKTLSKYAYGYDAAGQLISDSTIDASTSTSGLAHTYTYDANRQLASSSVGTTKSTYAATDAGVLSALPGTSLTTNTGSALTKVTPASAAATTATVNANGARASSTVAASGSAPAATTTYTYSPSGSLASVALPGTAGTVTYKSDGTGLRQTRTVGSVTGKYLWSTAKDLPRLLNDGTISYLYGPGGRVLEEITDSSQAVQWTTTDLLGSVRMITNTAGASLATYAYGPYGTPARTGTAISTIQFAGEMVDSSTGLLYLRARDYDPATSQFLTVDPALDLTHQPYAYARNNPLLVTDPSGLFAPAVLGAVIGALSGAVVGGASYAITSSVSGNFSAQGLLGSTVGGAAGGAVGGACVGLSFGVAAVACGAASGAVGEAVTQFVSGTPINYGSIALAAGLGGVGAALPPVARTVGFQPYKMSNVFRPGINAQRIYANALVSGAATGAATWAAGQLVGSAPGGIYDSCIC